MAPEDRIGTTSIPVDTEKIVAIIESDYRDQTTDNSPPDATSRGIAGHLIEFLEHEVSQDRLPKNLLPIQSGIGNIANAVIGGLSESKFEHLKVWTEVSPGSRQFDKKSLTRDRFCKTPFWIFSTLAV
jgi:acetyl-CoA hydrolase